MKKKITKGIRLTKTAHDSENIEEKHVRCHCTNVGNTGRNHPCQKKERSLGWKCPFKKYLADKCTL